MSDQYKTNKQLINELEKLRRRVGQLEESEAEWRRTEGRLRENDSRYRALIENSVEGVWHIDMNGHTTYLNRAMCSIIEIDEPSELSGITYHRFFTPESLNIMQLEHAKRPKGKGSSYEVEIVGKHGGRRCVIISGTPIFSDHGKLQGLIGVFTDITERRQAQEALRESEERFRKMAENIREVFWLFDWKDRKFLYVSPAYEDIWKRPVKALYGRYNDWNDAIHPDDLSYAQESFNKILETGGGEDREYRIIRPDGEVRWVSDRGFSIKDTDGLVRHIAGVAEDITKRKRMEAERIRLATILETTSDLVSTATPDARIMYMNQAGKTMLGWPDDEDISNKKISDIHPERPLQVIMNKGIPEAVQNGAWMGETAILSSDGKEIPVSQLIMSHKSPHGKLEYLSTIMRDISASKRAREEILLEKHFSDSVINSLPGIFYLFNEKGNLTRWNRNLEKITGYTTEEIAEMKPTDFFIGDEKKLLFAEIKKVLSSGSSQMEANLVTKDRSKIPYYFTGLLFIMDGKSYVLGAGLDISEQKQAKEILRESEELYSNILESISDGIVALDHNFHYTHWNRAMEKISKMPREQVVGIKRLPWELFPHLTDQGVDKMMRKTMHGEISHRENIPHRLGDGTAEFTMETFLPLKTADGKIRGIVGVIRDVTEEKRTELENKKLQAQLAQAQKIEALGTLAGGIAHDFNNLLMSIQGNASLMLFDKDSGDPDYSRLKNIEEYVRNGADLTKQLLGFARGGRYEVKPIDINMIVKKSSQMFGRTEKSITIHAKYQDHIWPVEADHSQIEQVMLNFYVNAWQAMPQEGELFLETENVTLDEKTVYPYSVKPGRYVKIAVTDTGIGMDGAIRKRIFDPFFTTKKMGKGTGLGLASTYGIIKNHGGIITVDSKKGHGSTFTVFLPASEKTVITEEKTDTEIRKGEETLLLVDDEEMIINVGMHMLEKMGYQVLVAKSGKEALKLYQQNMDHIGLVILDMIMPEMGGGEIYDRLKAINPEIKVLLSSGYSIDGNATEILKRGCNGFLQKPFNMKELSGKIRKILDK